jgi:hypothetical protein
MTIKLTNLGGDDMTFKLTNLGGDDMTFKLTNLGGDDDVAAHVLLDPELVIEI